MTNEFITRIRLSGHDLGALFSCFRKYFLESDGLWVFGSRADDTKKGGDLDLYIETYETDIERVSQICRDFLWDLEQKIDFPRNSTSEGNCVVAPVLKSSRTLCTLRFCAPYAPNTCSSEASFAGSLIDIVLNMLNNPRQLPIYEIAKSKGIRIT